MFSRGAQSAAAGRAKITAPQPTAATSAIAGVYAITPAGVDDSQLLNMVAQAAAGGVRLFQYRNPQADERARRRQAKLLAKYCRNHDCTLIINDFVEIAKAVGAHGVHLGKNDMPLEDARAALGEQAMIGATCHNDISRAQSMVGQGASYVALGAMFASATKPTAPRCSLATLTHAVEQLSIPVVAIGGITPANARALQKTGAACVAVGAGLFAATNITHAAWQLQSEFVV